MVYLNRSIVVLRSADRYQFRMTERTDTRKETKKGDAESKNVNVGVEAAVVRS